MRNLPAQVERAQYLEIQIQLSIQWRDPLAFRIQMELLTLPSANPRIEGLTYWTSPVLSSLSSPCHIDELLLLSAREMPKIKTGRVNYPDGWELIAPTLHDLEAKMRQAENDPNDGKRKCEALWPIFHIAHQKSRCIYDLYYKRQEISRELYEFCLEQGYADANLIAKWKKPGYERLCCLRCIQTRDHNFGTTCMCRVPSLP
ncbi:hypothetical protein LUZ62_060477 [Rhynchospora pubera]|uniref:G10 protein n=1 Tax=Rhynchospora pubera TaxID=906938 RepID=A0AAV8E9I2_9POAL|nr:hypothetical protein LUZ62_060477 [Rhynchospora pubera]